MRRGSVRRPQQTGRPRYRLVTPASPDGSRREWRRALPVLADRIALR